LVDVLRFDIKYRGLKAGLDNKALVYEWFHWDCVT